MLVEIGTQLSVAESGFNRDGLRLTIQLNHFVQRFEGEKLGGGIGDIVEAVPRAQHLKLVFAPHKLLNIVERGRLI